MTPAAIKAAIEQAGTSQSAIARSLGVSQVSIMYVILDRRRSRRIAEEIARVTGRSVEELWPGVYRAGAQGLMPARSREHRARIEAAIRRQRRGPLRLWAPANKTGATS